MTRQQIRDAHIVVADMTGQNANVYYEVGYAHGIDKKRVVLLAKSAEDLPADLRNLNHIIYDGRIRTLRDRLSERLRALRM